MPTLEGSALIARCREIDDATSLAMSRDLIQLLEEVSKVSGCYTFKYRPKGFKAINKKVRRKRAEGYFKLSKLNSDRVELIKNNFDNAKTSEEIEIAKAITYGPEHVTDAWGCRYITLYQSEIPPIINSLLNELQKFNLKNKNQIRMSEFVIYTNRPKNDPLSIAKQTFDLVRQFSISRSIISDDSIIRDPENRKSAYSSVHFVFERDVDILHGDSEGVEEETVYFEVQIRDIFEEGWGEVQHQLLYSGKDDLDKGFETELESNTTWKIHLNALKTFVDGCSQHASIIKQSKDAQYKAAPPSITSQSATRYSENQLNLVKSCRENGIKKEFIKSINSAYAALIAAEDSDIPQKKITWFLEAIKVLDALQQSNDRGLSVVVAAEEGRSVKYFVDMERAYCDLSLGENAERRLEAITHYENAAKKFMIISREYIKDPISRYRLAQSLAKTAKTNEELAIVEKVLEECINNYKEKSLTGMEGWFIIAAKVLLGWCFWAQSKLMKESMEIKRKLDLAIEVTISAYRIWEDQDISLKEKNKIYAHKAGSNILYYCYDIHKTGLATKRENDKIILEFLDFIESVDVRYYKEFYRTKDNIVHALLALGRPEDVLRASELARENFIELRALAEGRSGRPLDKSEVPNYLGVHEIMCFDATIGVLEAASTQ